MALEANKYVPSLLFGIPHRQAFGVRLEDFSNSAAAGTSLSSRTNRYERLRAARRQIPRQLHQYRINARKTPPDLSSRRHWVDSPMLAERTHSSRGNNALAMAIQDMQALSIKNRSKTSLLNRAHEPGDSGTDASAPQA